ncbi:hypothetical protein PO909_016973 [Leuciscus waleckii]
MEIKPQPMQTKKSEPEARSPSRRRSPRSRLNSSILSLGALSSTSAHRPVSSILALHPLGSTWDPRPFDFTGLPCPTGYTLVSCRPTIATDFWGCLLHFIPPPLRLRQASPSLRPHRGPYTGVISVLRLPNSTLATRRLDFAVVSQSFGVTGSFGLRLDLYISRHHCCRLGSKYHLGSSLHHCYRGSPPSWPSRSGISSAVCSSLDPTTTHSSKGP